MNTLIRIKPLVEGGILSGIAVLLCLLSAYVPILGALISFSIPLPIVILVVRHNIRTGVVASIVVATLTAILIQPSAGLKVLLSINVMGLVLGWCLRERYSAEKTILFGAGATLIAVISAGLLGLIILGINPITAIQEQSRIVTDMTLQQLAQNPLYQNELELHKEILKKIEWLAMIVFPVLVLMFCFGMSYVNYRLARPILQRTGYEVNALVPLRLWDFPKHVFVGWFIGFASFLASRHYFGTESLTFKFSLNVLFCFSIILLLQGLALVSYYASKYKLPKVARLFLIIFICFYPPVTLVVIYVGITDLLYNFRQLERKG